ncbi:uncharacterized protein LOC133885513 [Phragmites australis]|uniref:uncharacterized protein LOC133885513 n=1 Tax=Phragmites australis TaxID=29695 RepID=UPI002D77521C|nr:uncharacterized protein LOC133885513 [Phragmites australis]
MAAALAASFVGGMARHHRPSDLLHLHDAVVVREERSAVPGGATAQKCTREMLNVAFHELQAEARDAKKPSAAQLHEATLNILRTGACCSSSMPRSSKHCLGSCSHQIGLQRWSS